VLAFAGLGADSAQEAARLARLTYEKIDNDICISGYATYPKPGGSE